MANAALGGIIDRLEVSSFIMRNPDPVDRRIKRVFLTTLGKQTIKEMRVISHEMSEQILEGLDNNERVLLADMLNKVKHNLLDIKSRSND